MKLKRKRKNVVNQNLNYQNESFYYNSHLFGINYNTFSIPLSSFNIEILSEITNNIYIIIFNFKFSNFQLILFCPFEVIILYI